jgi:hypothetical protein
MGCAVIHSNLAAAMLRTRRADEAYASLHSLAASIAGLGDIELTIEIIELLAGAFSQRGDAGRAARLVGTTEALREQAGMPIREPDAALLAEFLAPARDLLTTSWNTMKLATKISSMRRNAWKLVDPAQRGVILIEEIPGDDDRDWLLTDLRDSADTESGLPQFERTLLDGLFAGRSRAGLGELGQDLIPALNRTRSQLYRDAVRRGWLRLWRQHQRTPHGEQLVKQINSFRRELRRLSASGDAVTSPQLAAYAIVFGLGGPAAVRLRADATKSAERDESAVEWSRDDLFAISWLGVCAKIARTYVGHSQAHGGLGNGHDFGGGHGGGAAHLGGHAGHGGY